MVNISDNNLYIASKIAFRVCLAIFCIYIFVSILFYIIGAYQFDGLQSGIIYNPLTYLVILLFFGSLAGLYFYKPNVDGDEPYIYRRRRRRSYVKILPPAGAIFMAALALYIFSFTKIRNEYTSSGKEDNAIVPVQTPDEANIEQRNSAIIEASSSRRPEKKATRDSAIVPPSKTQESDVPSSKVIATKDDEYTSTELRYKIVSRAYLYTAPAENKKRKAFLRANSSSDLLMPKGERNGFVYIVFTNDEGQTVMGWLNKKDLRPVNEVVYNYSK